jgi:hypothetical protein
MHVEGVLKHTTKHEVLDFVKRCTTTKGPCFLVKVGVVVAADWELLWFLAIVPTQVVLLLPIPFYSLSRSRPSLALFCHLCNFPDDHKAEIDRTLFSWHFILLEFRILD